MKKICDMCILMEFSLSLIVWSTKSFVFLGITIFPDTVELFSLSCGVKSALRFNILTCKLPPNKLKIQNKSSSLQDNLSFLNCYIL